MSNILTLPVELSIEISEWLRPPCTAVIGHDAAWADPIRIHNWWDKSRAVEQINTGTPHPVKASYAHLLALRRVNRAFNKICTPLLYYEFNHLVYGGKDGHITTEVISLYHIHFRVVRIAAERPEYSNVWKKIYDLLLTHLGASVNALGVYYINSEIFDSMHWGRFITEIVALLEKGSITSFGIYSDTVFSKSVQHYAPRGATTLLGEVLASDKALSRVTSLDIAIDRIEPRRYNALRAQITHLRSITIRATLRDDLPRFWDEGQQRRWQRCSNLTSLKLIHCDNAYAPHIPHILQFFPALRNVFLSGCRFRDDIVHPDREMGQSFKECAIWGHRPPLESLHLESVLGWEITALGVIHTKMLILTTVDRDDVTDCFADEEIFPCLRIIKSEGKYSSEIMEAKCAERGIALESDAKALIVWRA